MYLLFINRLAAPYLGGCKLTATTYDQNQAGNLVENSTEQGILNRRISRRRALGGLAAAAVVAGVVTVGGGAAASYLGSRSRSKSTLLAPLLTSQQAPVPDTSSFPVGYYQIYDDPALNFRFNFWYNCYYAGTGDDSMLSEMKSFAPSIKTYDDWKSQFLTQAEEANSNGETLKAAYYYRGADFIMLPTDPQKQPTRELFLQLTRSAYGLNNLEFAVPYTQGSQSGNLPGYRLTPANPKGTLVIFGGYDSYIEELVPQAFVFRDAGYDVILFEGPGQGGALEDYGLTMTPDWEKPVGAILDHFGLDSVSLMGISLGGYLVIRAAAFEPRVQRAIADDVIYNFSDCIWSALPAIDADVLHLLDMENSVNPLDGMAFNALVERAMQGSLYENWAIHQGLHVFGLSSPLELFQNAEKYTSAEISGRLNQQVLLLAGSKDLDVPVQMFYNQIQALPNVSSLTARLFTEAEQAQNHCQVGNIGLQLNYIIDWLNTIQ